MEQFIRERCILYMKTLKDNLSMINKRLRCNEYIGSFVTAEVSKRINRIVSLGDKASIRDYLKR